MTVKRTRAQDTTVSQGTIIAPPEKRVLLIHFADVILSKVRLSSKDLMSTFELETCETAIVHLTKVFDQVYVLFKSSKKENQTRVANWMTATNFVERNHLSWDRILFCDGEDQLQDIYTKLGVTHVIHPDINKCGKHTGVKVILADWGAEHKVQLLPDEKKFVTRAKGWLDVKSLLTTDKHVELKEV